MNLRDYKYTKEDRDAVSAILQDAFLGSPEFSWIIASDKKGFAKRMKAACDIAVISMEKYAVFCITEDSCGVSIWKRSTSKSSAFEDIKLLSLMIWKLGIKYSMRMIASENLLMKNRPTGYDYLALTYLAVKNEKQGLGYSSLLLDGMLEKAKTENMAVVLETSKEKNVDFYKYKGFSLYKTSKKLGTFTYKTMQKK